MSARALALPLAAVLLVAVVLGVQAAAGGTDYVPQKPADPCRSRPARPVARGLEPLVEQVVLVGLDETACRAGVSRERLVLALASAPDRRALAARLGTDERGLAAMLRAGLVRGVDRLDRQGRLPAASKLLPAIEDELDLPEIARPVIEAIPDRVVDDLLPTGPVLRRALAKIDVDTLLRGLRDPDRLEPALRKAIQEAALEEIRVRLQSRVPDSLGDLFGD